MRDTIFPMIFLRRIALALLSGVLPTLCLFAAEKSAPGEMERGRELYLRNCFVCHQISGQGIPGTYPPLANSDFLAADQTRAIRVLCEGLSGEIVVNGKKFRGTMPPVVLDDAETAAVLTYVGNSWGNTNSTFTAEQVKAVRATTQFPTFEKLQEASTYAPLPPAPPGFTLREVVRMTTHGVRMASDGTGRIIYVLIENGDVWRLEPGSGKFQQILWAKNYLDHQPGDTAAPLFVLGMTLGKDGRLYIASNQANNLKPPFLNRVTIYRTSTRSEDGDPSEPKVWFEKSYPGNSAFVHGMENIAFGPDGFLYAGNGARTDANQPNSDPNYDGGGEMPLTSSIWRIDPRSDKPQFEVYARGVRNSYGFCWNDKGEMFATENGPDADAPEELNLIEKGKHYGFPYQFANWTHKAYEHTPDAPAGLTFTLPIANLGPDGGFEGSPIYTFDPHSGPGGIVFLGDDFPEGWRGNMVLNRFGNFIRTPNDNVGFDILKVSLRKNEKGVYVAHVYKVLGPLGRPIDIHHSGKGKLYICEYTRPTNNAGSFALPGRILELAVKPSAAK